MNIDLTQEVEKGFLSLKLQINHKRKIRQIYYTKRNNFRELRM